MGCVTSKNDINDVHPNIFQVLSNLLWKNDFYMAKSIMLCLFIIYILYDWLQVHNVDELGNRISSGELEINETELVLHQRGKPPVRWPLKTLRRYGYEDQVFSFETGRRCPTGSGIYAFSCKRAEKLFNHVQSNIQVIYYIYSLSHWQCRNVICK